MQMNMEVQLNVSIDPTLFFRKALSLNMRLTNLLVYLDFLSLPFCHCWGLRLCWPTQLFHRNLNSYNHACAASPSPKWDTSTPLCYVCTKFSLWLLSALKIKINNPHSPYLSSIYAEPCIPKVNQLLKLLAYSGNASISCWSNQRSKEWVWESMHTSTLQTDMANLETSSLFNYLLLWA